jgi:uncharacterized protein YprB with RNaseH-like and TPR domain
MLRNTFCHLPGIGEKTERDLWSAGVPSWQAALDWNGPCRPPFRRSCIDHLRESLARYQARDAAYFSARLSPRQQWRLFADFRNACAFVDIETTGMSSATDEVTAVTLYDGCSVRTYVRGANLDAFPRAVAAYRVLVTYNGRSFDVPFLERCFGIALDQAHIDLRYVLTGLGIRGGLKSCERQLGLRRDALEEVDGFMAVRLWHEYRRRGDRRALETLLAYNVQDTVNLETLLVLTHNRCVAATPFSASHRLAVPVPAANPYTPDADVVQRCGGMGRSVLPFAR